MKVGDTVTVFGWHARDGSNWAHSRQVTFADGKKLFFGPPAGTGDGGNTPAVEVQVMRGWVVPVALAMLSGSVSAQTKSPAKAKRSKSVPRASDGKPDLTGVWQGGSERPGTWEEANTGGGAGGTETRPHGARCALLDRSARGQGRRSVSAVGGPEGSRLV